MQINALQLSWILNRRGPPFAVGMMTKGRPSVLQNRCQTFSTFFGLYIDLFGSFDFDYLLVVGRPIYDVYACFYGNCARKVHDLHTKSWQPIYRGAEGRWWRIILNAKFSAFFLDQIRRNKKSSSMLDILDFDES